MEVLFTEVNRCGGGQSRKKRIRRAEFDRSCVFDSFVAVERGSGSCLS